MMRFVTHVLSRAVPSVRVDLVKLVGQGRVKGYYWFWVVPHHDVYWMRFQKDYPHYGQVARFYGAAKHSLISGWRCPEFPTKVSLVDWLADVLNLSCGERNLLRLLKL